MLKFTAHRLSGSNALFPNRIEVDAMNVIYFKGNFIGYHSSAIARNNIASVSIESEVFFANIIIETIGGEKIIASGFSKGDAKEILRILTNRIRIIRL